MLVPAVRFSLVLSLLLAASACGASAGSDADAGPTGDDDAGPDVCARQCSGDGRQVLDCEGEVLEVCTDQQACAGSVCVDACEAARDSNSTVGCDYHVVAPDIIDVAQGGCFAAFVANTWATPIEIAVERGSQALDVSQFARIPSGSGPSLTYAPLPDGVLPPGEVAILFLSRFGNQVSNCPPGIVPAVTTEDPALHGTGIGASFQIATSAPVVAYDIYPYGGGESAATSATLLLPTSAWDQDYIAVDAYAASTITEGVPFIEIVAAQDDTDVTIRPTAAIAGGGGVAPAAAGTPTTYTLQRGQVLQFTQSAQLIGSPIQATKPIGVWGGSTCLNIESNQGYCDSAHQQIAPVRALGSEYAAVRYRNRYDGLEESPPWRLVGAVDGTTLTYEPSAPAGAPTTLDAGQVALFPASGPFVVRSQDEDHPFYVSAHMTGCQSLGQLDCRGDPEFVNVVPPAQFLASYTFFTDPTYPETNLVIVRERGPGGFADVTLPCHGAVAGWQPIDAGGRFEYARLDLSRGSFEPQGSCDNGRHVMTSERPFGLTVWGWGSGASGGFTEAVSYAYPAGAGLESINDVVID